MNNFFAKFKIKPKQKTLQGPSIINPHKHWGILLSIFSVIIFCLIVFSLYLLYQIKNDQIFQVVPTEQENSRFIKEDLLKSVTESFDQKSKKENELKNNPLSYPDPSL